MSRLPVVIALLVALAVAGCTPRTSELIEVVEVNRVLSATNLFFLLPDSTELDDDAYVGRLRMTATHEGNATLGKLYPALRARANQMGANSFRVEGGCSDSSPCVIAVDLFKAPGDVVDEGPAFWAEDAVFVFGPLDPDEAPSRVEVGGEKVSVPPLRYAVYANDSGEGLTLSVGGLLGSSLTLEGGLGRDPTYWSLSNPGLGPASTPRGGLGVSFNTGRFYPVDAPTGRFLAALLRRIDA